MYFCARSNRLFRQFKLRQNGRSRFRQLFTGKNKKLPLFIFRTLAYIINKAYFEVMKWNGPFLCP